MPVYDISLLKTLYKFFKNTILPDRVPFIIRNNVKKENRAG